MRLNDASAIIDIIDGRVAAKTGSMAQVETTYGQVLAIDTDQSASAYIYGAATASPGFRARNGFVPKSGDAVRVSKNGAGDRWIEEVIPSAYYPMQFDVTGGVINWADAATGVTDTNLYRGGVNLLKTDDALTVGGLVTASAGMAFTGSGTELDIVNMTGSPNGPDIRFGDGTGWHIGFAPRTGTNAGKHFFILSDSGVMSWADPTTGITDTDLYRGAANQLKTTHDIYVGGNLTVISVADVTGYLRARSNLYLGTASYYMAVNGNGIGFLNAGAALLTKQKGILLSASYADPDPPTAGIQFGADTILYRETTNLLATDDFFVAGRTQPDGSATIATQGSGRTGDYTFLLYNDATKASGVIEFGDGTTSTNRDTNLYRGAANTLQTDDMLNAPIVGALYTGGTAITGIAAGTTSANLTFGTKTYDTGNSYDSTNKRWVVPTGKGGMYLLVFTFNVVNQTNASNAGTRVSVYQNSTNIGQTWIAPGEGGSNIQGPVISILSAAAGDTFSANANPIGNAADVSIVRVHIVRLHSATWMA